MRSTQLRQVARMGRGRDTRLSHTKPGDVVVPPEVLDNNPSLATALIKAFQKQGIDWRSRIAGSGNVNPNTGLEEFETDGGGGNDPTGGSDAASGGGGNDSPDREGAAGGPGAPDGPRGGPASPGPTETEPTSFDPNTAPVSYESPGQMDQNLANQQVATTPAPPSAGQKAIDTVLDFFGVNPRTNPQAAMLGAMPGAGLGLRAMGKARDTLESWGADISDDYSSLDAIGAGGNGRDGVDLGMSPAQSETIKEAINKFLRPPAQDAPQFLQLNPSMTDLQRRSNIATYGTQGVNSAYRDPQTQKYYRNLVERGFIDDSGNLADIGNLLPIERQYLRESLGLPEMNTTRALLEAIARV